MTRETVYRRDVDYAQPRETIAQAASRMRQRTVGSLVVVNSEHVPVGIVTDRDLVVRALSERLDPDSATIEEVMTPRPVTVKADATPEQALALMRETECRRLPVVDGDGKLVGIVCLDDLLLLLRDAMSSIGRLLVVESPGGIVFEDVPS